MTANSQFLSGVIEGFYGQCWSWESREAYANFLADSGMNSYIYAPKSDGCLRKRWRQHWPDKEFQQLKKLSAVYRRAGLNFGLGLSPFELYRNFDRRAKVELKVKLEQIESLAPSVLCILFDDMSGDLPHLAELQIEICDFVVANISVDRLVMCPTYYSFDSVLEKVFGLMPVDYWQQLGRGLSSDWDVFWTGDEVISKNYSTDSLTTITRKLGRKPLLWDNYPVNDGAKISNFLHLSSANRNAELKKTSQGLLCNPMNQSALSKAAIFSTALQLHGEEVSQRDLFNHLFGDELACMLIQDLSSFEQVGLAGLSAAVKQCLKDKYKNVNHLAAKEVFDWLDDKYTFDSACLTD